MMSQRLSLQSIRFVALAFLATLVLSIIQITPTYAATVVWDGGGGDNNVSTANNWVGDVAPSNGDILSFPADSVASSVTNDSLTDIGGFILGTGATDSGIVVFTGNDFTLSGDSTLAADRGLTFNNVNVTLAANVQFELGHDTSDLQAIEAADVNVSGGDFDLATFTLDLTIDNFTQLDAADLPLSYGIYVPTFYTTTGSLSGSSGSAINIYGLAIDLGSVDNTGLVTTITATDGQVEADEVNTLGSAELILNNSRLEVSSLGTTLKNFDQNITFNGNLYGAGWGDNFGIGQGGFYIGGDFDVEFSGTIAVTEDLTIEIGSPAGGRTVTFSGDLSGDGLIGSDGDDEMSLVVSTTSNTSATPDGDYQVVSDYNTTITSDDAAKDLIIVPFGRAYVNGTRGNVIVSGGGTLGGTGTVGTITVQTLGILAPGTSPGCLSSGDLSFTAGSIYTVEIDGATQCSGYDNTDVTGTVTLGDATLTIDRGTTYTPATGTVFEIISNDGADAVSGTFSGVPEGGTVTVDGVTYAVSYVGGDGNDVTLTVGDVAAPAADDADAPDTGFPLLQVNTLIPLISTILATTALGVVIRRQTVKQK